MTEQPKGDQPKNEGQAKGTFPIDHSSLSTVYTNFCQASITPEELILDFGLNPQWPTTTEPVKLTHRIVMNFYTAKRLLLLLNNVISQHEKAFGALELDVQRRARFVAPAPTPPPTDLLRE